MHKPMFKTFEAKELNEIRHTLSDKIWVRSQSPIGWSFLRKDFSFIFSILPSLKFREGYTIRAYRYVAADKSSLKLQFWATDDWKWKINRDNISWKPSVQFDGDNVKVTFYTYYGHLKKQIFKHTDTYAKGSYKFDSNCKIIAEGGEGYYI